VAESSFIANRDAGRLVRTTLVSSGVRLGLLVLLLPLGALAAFSAQTAAWATALSLLVYRLCRGGAYRPRIRIDRVSVQLLWRFSMGNYLAALVGGIPATVLPLLLLDKWGTASVTYWYVAYAVASLLFTLPSMVSRSMLAEGSYQEAGRLSLIRKGSQLIAGTVLPILVVAWLAAPLLLQMFGASYGHAAVGLLRYLIASAVMVGANFIFGTVLYLDKRVFFSTIVNAANALVVLLLAVFASSLVDIGRAWFWGEVVNVLLFGAGAWWVVRNRREAWGDAVVTG
jgi:O-antigen/teichoic acid export membrane protein